MIYHIERNWLILIEAVTLHGPVNFPHHNLCLLFIHPRAPNLISLRSAGTMPT